MDRKISMIFIFCLFKSRRMLKYLFTLPICMKFAHLADCHIGAWRDPKMRKISLDAFTKAVEICIEKEADFVILSGDLFNTSFPSIDALKLVVQKLRELKDKGIPVYGIAGSHDFSASGKTMLDVLEEAGLFINVVKGEINDKKLKLIFTIDDKTGVKLTGMLGKRGMLERKYYEELDRDSIENESGTKIFVFHTALTELKPKELEKMASSPISMLPKRFDYYAAGHVHERKEHDEEGYGKIVYPGPLFPNSFREIEKMQRGGFYFVDEGNAEYIPLQIINTKSFNIDCENKNVEEIENEVYSEIKNKEFYDTVVTIRLFGKLKSGKPSDINFKEIFKTLYDKSAYYVMKSTTKLVSQNFEEVKIEHKNVEDIESSLINEHLNQVKLEGISKEEEGLMTKEFMKILESEKDEGEKAYDFERRIKEGCDKLLDL